jgi:replicative DNA helicase
VIHSDTRTSQRHEATPSRPCQVCGATRGCSAGSDGLLFCRGVTGDQSGFAYLGQAKTDSQWSLYRVREDAPAPRSRPQSATKRAAPRKPALVVDAGSSEDGGSGEDSDSSRETWESRARGLVPGFSPALRAELAASLAIPVGALDAIPWLGYDSADRYGPCFTFPEHSGEGGVIGLTRRYADGIKRAAPGSTRGLTLPVGWSEIGVDGPVLIVEGATDSLALVAAGQGVVGRPSNTGGIEHLSVLLNCFPVDRSVIIMGENDQKANGQWPGRQGAQEVSRRLADRLDRTLWWALPPAGSKDARDWLVRECAGSTDPAKWKEAGRKFVAGLVCEIVHPQRVGLASDDSGDDPPWDRPIDFAEHRTPAFPLQVLPTWLREWVAAVAEHTQTPEDLAAVLGLSVCAAGVARKVCCDVPHGWTEPLNLFGLVAMGSANRKSAVFSQALRPVREYERRQVELAKPRVALAVSEKRRLEERLKQAERAAVKASHDERLGWELQCSELSRQVAAFTIPAVPQFVADDVTPEKLGQMLAEQGGRLLVASSEATFFKNVLGRYSEGNPNVETVLKAHAGDAIRVNRLGRPGDEIDSPALSLAVAPQPSTLSALAEDPALRQNGFLARILYSVPRSRVGARQVVRGRLSDAVRESYELHVLRLWGLATPDESSGYNPRRIALDAAGDQVLQGFEEWLEPQLAEGGALWHVIEWAGKLAGTAVRLAGVLHLAESVDGRAESPVIPERVVCSAIELCRDYFLCHAQAAFGLMAGDPQRAMARTVLNWLKSRRVTLTSKRDLYRSLHRAFGDSIDAVDPVLTLLAKHGYLREVTGNTKGKFGRPSSPNYAVNPLWLAEPDPTAIQPIQEGDSDAA